MNLGKKLRCMRQAQGLSTIELAKRARVTTAFISQLEHSHTVPSLQTLQRIAAVLEVSLPYLVGEEPSNGTSTPGHADRLDMRPQGAEPTAVAYPAAQPYALMEHAMDRPDDPQRVFAYQHVKERPKLLHAMTSLTQGEFEQLLPHFQRAWQQYLQQHAGARDERLRQYGGGKPATLVQLEDKMLFILYYVKLGPLQEILAFEFGMVQSTAHEWIRILSAVLQRALAQGGYVLARAPKPLKTVLKPAAASPRGVAGATVPALAW